MLPKKVEWKDWSTLDRITYLAQVAVVVTLFATSWFSYATWQEAKAARQAQEAMFSAQNGPLVHLVRASIEENFRGRRTLMLTFANAGGSVARNTCATIRTRNGAVIHDYCTEQSSQIAALRPSQSFFYSPPIATREAQAIGFMPAAAATRQVGEEVVRCDVGGVDGRLNMLVVTIRYQDVLNQQLTENAEVALCDGRFVDRS